MSARKSIREIETGTPELLARIEERVAVLTLNRPEAKNALTMELKEALYRAVTEVAEDPEVGCVLLTGAGTAFCAGGDTKKMAADGKPPSMEDRQRQLRWEHRLPYLLHTMPKPTLCALPGPAAGAGCSIALSCDLRIAAERAFLLAPFLKLGLSGDYGGSWFLTQMVGIAKAREIYFGGERLGAQECLELGIVNRLVPEAELEREAFEWAARLAAGPPIATAYMKANLNRALVCDLRTALDHEADRMVRGAMTDDYREAVTAFAEKRKPIFEGR